MDNSQEMTVSIDGFMKVNDLSGLLSLRDENIDRLLAWLLWIVLPHHEPYAFGQISSVESRNVVICKMTSVCMNSWDDICSSMDSQIGDDGFSYPWRYITEKSVWMLESRDAILFDESRFCLQHHDGRILRRNHLRERTLPASIRHRHTGPSSRLIEWDATRYTSRSLLVGT